MSDPCVSGVQAALWPLSCSSAFVFGRLPLSAACAGRAAGAPAAERHAHRRARLQGGGRRAPLGGPPSHSKLDSAQGPLAFAHAAPPRLCASFLHHARECVRHPFRWGMSFVGLTGMVKPRTGMRSTLH